MRFKIGSKVKLNEVELLKSYQSYKDYKHLLEKELKIVKFDVYNNLYELDIKPKTEWVGIGITGKYINIIPKFKEDMLIQTENFATVKTNRIKRVAENGKESIIEWDIINDKIKVDVKNNPIHVTTLLKILLDATELYKESYKRISPYKVTRNYNTDSQKHLFTLDFIDIKDDFKEKHSVLIEADKNMQVLGKVTMFKYDLTELAVERKILSKNEDGYKLIKDLSKVMNNCQYIKSKPGVGSLLKQGYTIPEAYKSL